jgi:hypothetical protein
MARPKKQVTVVPIVEEKRPVGRPRTPLDPAKGKAMPVKVQAETYRVLAEISTKNRRTMTAELAVAVEFWAKNQPA